MVHLLQSFDPPPEILEAEDLRGAEALLKSDSSIDLVLLDLKLTDSKGTEALLALRKQVPDTALVILSGERDPDIIHSCIDNGAMGFISKAATHDELLSAIKLIVAGGVYLPREITSAYRSGQRKVEKSDVSLLASLSDRQREVLTYLLQGKPNKTISEKMNISQNTVKAHLSGIFKILGARNRTEAVYFAARAGVPIE